MPGPVKNIIIYEIGMDKEEAVTFKFMTRYAVGAAGPEDALRSAIDTLSFSVRPYDPVKPEPYNIQIEEGTNIYAIKLAPYIGTQFGNAVPPISLLPNGFKGAVDLVSDISLRAKGKEKVDNFSTDLANIIDHDWLVFTADQAEIGKKLRAAIEDPAHQHISLFVVPFYINLYDKLAKTPNWLLAYHDHEEPQSGGPVKEGLLGSLQHLIERARQGTVSWPVYHGRPHTNNTAPVTSRSSEGILYHGRPHPAFVGGLEIDLPSVAAGGGDMGNLG